MTTYSRTLRRQGLGIVRIASLSLAAAFVLAACGGNGGGLISSARITAAPPLQTASLGQTSARGVSMADMLTLAADTTLPAGWRMGCVRQGRNASYFCFAGTFGKNLQTGAPEPFVIVFDAVDGGPIFGAKISPGERVLPSNIPVVRVDSHAPMRDMRDPRLISQLRGGLVAQAEYPVSGAGMVRMAVPLAGFDEAYQALTERVRFVSKTIL